MDPHPAYAHTISTHRYLATWLNGGEYEGKEPIKKTRTGDRVVVSLGVADHVHGRGGAWPHINKKRGIVWIDGGIFR